MDVPPRFLSCLASSLSSDSCTRHNYSWLPAVTHRFDVKPTIETNYEGSRRRSPSLGSRLLGLGFKGSYGFNNVTHFTLLLVQGHCTSIQTPLLSSRQHNTGESEGHHLPSSPGVASSVNDIADGSCRVPQGIARQRLRVLGL